MRQRFAIFITVAALVALLVLLNAASYSPVERTPDVEFNPDRSTYNAGATGTRALYDLLTQAGRSVMRWDKEPQLLLDKFGGRSAVSTFVVIGEMRRPFMEEETTALLVWVEQGGRLVIIDRRADPRLLPRSGNWIISMKAQGVPNSGVHPNKTEEMTAGVSLVRASQPTLLTRNVEAVMPSRFAGTINFSEADPTPVAEETEPSPPPPAVVYGTRESSEPEPPPPPPPRASATPSATTRETQVYSPAPVAHLGDYRGALLIDYPHGRGRIIVLSDPYIVANGGIRLADNLQLALNAVADPGGVIAFDEYHQGRTASRNELLAYFEGTPVLWMLAQGALVVLVWLWTRGRRFARPLPLARVDRRSSLEFVGSMAELQQRARAYDLAIENIYTRLRRVLVRYAGLSHNSPRSEIAARVAARSQKVNAAQLESLMRECEDAINGAPVDAGKALDLVKRLRWVERALGLRMRSRETHQAAEGL